MPARTTSQDVAESAAYFIALVATIGGRRRVDLSAGEIGEAFDLLRQDAEDAGLFTEYERCPNGRYRIPPAEAPGVEHATQHRKDQAHV